MFIKSNVDICAMREPSIRPFLYSFNILFPTTQEDIVEIIKTVKSQFSSFVGFSLAVGDMGSFIFSEPCEAEWDKLYDIVSAWKEKIRKRHEQNHIQFI